MVRYILPIEIQPLEEGGYLARSPALPGFLVQADTVEKAINLAPGVAQTLIEAMQEKGITLPETLHTIEPPFHGSKDIPKGTLAAILRDLDLTKEELDKA